MTLKLGKKQKLINKFDVIHKTRYNNSTIILKDYLKGDKMLVSVTEYAKLYNKDTSVIRRHCINGKFKTAKKIGNSWVIDDKEPYIENSRNRKKNKGL